jgi:hypothetical protein
MKYKDKLLALIKKLEKENKKLEKDLEKGLTKYKSFVAKQRITKNNEFITELNNIA